MKHCLSHAKECALLACLALLASMGMPKGLVAQEMLHPRLDVRTVVDGLVTPTTMAFIGPNDILVLEKNTGQVKRVANGNVDVVLDLAVNLSGNSGLLGVTVHPQFEDNGFVYLYWTESTSGDDSDVLSEMPLLGNRLDRFVWDGDASALTFERNLIMLRSLQPPNPPCEPNAFGVHDGGVLAFGPDGKLYMFIGDVGRRGQLQNLPFGHQNETCLDPNQDDQFGGPEPDDAHLTGVVLRFNDDGSTPSDNPFFEAGAQIGGEVGANIQKIFSYGHRNSFGMDFDPISGDLWLEENGDDSFSELNRVEPGMNGGWVQVIGPSDRLDQYKDIETSDDFFGLQQERWPPTNIADTPQEALSRLFMLPGAHYSEPEFSWKWEIAPAAIGFARGRALGPQFRGDLFMGAAIPVLEGGWLFHFNITGNRRKIGVDDPRIEDRVADNLAKHEITESESLLIGRNFGSLTDIESGPNGNLYTVSFSNGAIYEIFGKGRFAASAAGEAGEGADVQGLAEASLDVPAQFEFSQNYPNPFNPVTSIYFALPEEATVTLDVFDVMGRRVARLVDGVRPAGEHRVSFDASNLSNGVYLYEIRAGSFREARTMTVLK